MERSSFSPQENGKEKGHEVDNKVDTIQVLGAAEETMVTNEVGMNVEIEYNGNDSISYQANSNPGHSSNSLVIADSTQVFGTAEETLFIHKTEMNIELIYDEHGSIYFDFKGNGNPGHSSNNSAIVDSAQGNAEGTNEVGTTSRVQSNNENVTNNQQECNVQKKSVSLSGGCLISGDTDSSLQPSKTHSDKQKKKEKKHRKRKSAQCSKPKVMFEGFSSIMTEYYAMMVENLGGMVTSEPVKATHVVLSPTVKIMTLTRKPLGPSVQDELVHYRNYRIWTALSTAKYFLRRVWIINSIDRKEFVSINSRHLVNDRSFEWKFNREISEVILHEQRNFLFSGITFLFLSRNIRNQLLSKVLSNAGAFIQYYNVDQSLPIDRTYYIIALTPTTNRERQILDENNQRASAPYIFLTNLRRICKAITANNTSYLGPSS